MNNQAHGKREVPNQAPTPTPTHPASPSSNAPKRGTVPEVAISIIEDPSTPASAFLASSEVTPEMRMLMRECIDLATHNAKSGKGGPFAAMVTRGGEVIARGTNIVTSSGDPTAHAEVVAIRRACAALGTFELHGCTLYTTCEPCPMCLGAIYWARPDKVLFAATRADAADVGFDDDFIYREIPLEPHKRSIAFKKFPCTKEELKSPFKTWSSFEERRHY